MMLEGGSEVILCGKHNPSILTSLSLSYISRWEEPSQEEARCRISQMMWIHSVISFTKQRHSVAGGKIIGDVTRRTPTSRWRQSRFKKMWS